MNPPSSSRILAKVNGEPVYEEDLSVGLATETREDRLKKAIQFQLIVQEGKRRGLERTPEIQSEINKLIYNKFIEQERKNQKQQFTPTEKELHGYYSRFPLIRIHHLVLYQRSETEKQVAALALEQIQKEIKAGTPFEKLCTQFSQDSSGLFGGDTDFRGPHNFPEDLYLKIRSLPKQAVSDPVEIGKAIHLFSWFDKKPFTSAPASYLHFLQSRFEQEKEKLLLSKLIKQLELSATIDPPSLSGSNK